MKIEIETANNGFITIVQMSTGEEKRIHDTLEDALLSICTDALLVIEGRSHNFSGKRHCEIKLQIK